MFYFFSKLLAFLIQPAMWIIFMIVAALFTRSAMKKRRRIIGALLLFFVFGNAFIFDQVMRQMEETRDGENDIKHVHRYAVLLGGYGEWNERSGDIELYGSSDRLTEAMDLYNKGMVKQIIVTSGVYAVDPEKTEAKVSKDFLSDNGIPAADIIIEDQSWNTYQNAFYCHQLIDSLSLGSDGILITSAFHMNRAQACFEKQGLQLLPHPVDYHSSGTPVSFVSALWPTMETVVSWTVPIKEWVGLAVYRMKGYT